MHLSAIVDSSVLFAGLGIGTTISDPAAYYFNGSSYKLDVGQSFQYTYYGRSFSAYGSAAVLQLEMTGSLQSPSLGFDNSDDPVLANNVILGIDLGIRPFDLTGQGDKNVMNVTALERAAEIDFLIYEPSPSRTVAGATLLLDDQDESMNFSGSWNQTRHDPLNATFPTGYALKYTISQTREPGATFKTKFVGSDIQVYGALQQVSGSVVIEYNVDGSFSDTVTLSHSSQEANETNWELNRLLFGHSDQASYGDENAEHTLEVTVKEITGDQMFTLDYLTFEGTPWTNVTAPGSALASPFPEPEEDSPGGTRKRKFGIGLGLSFSLAAMIGVGLL
ncbi:hypothetical protein BKA70DRAFT_1559162 [Coprinopsis sp. MPI-PUGE-AT-0042]|nr:hypothetical protein BKA70DRAFT_1559162 [Coprinopsis sp. MPI-PUGE-AT-0042]